MSFTLPAASPSSPPTELLAWAVLNLLAGLNLLHRLLAFLAVPPRPQKRAMRLPALRLLLAAAICLLVLSGCGTAPSPAWTSPPVPAELLTPPRPPVPLQPASPSKTPGATTPSTPASAPRTG